MCIAGLCSWQPATAGSVVHNNLSEFSPGVSDGVVQAMEETFSGTPRSGAVGVVPSPGASIFSDELDYTTATAASANWMFLTPFLEDHSELATNPSEFLFSGDASATGGTAPAAGTFRMRVSRNQDFFNTAVVGQRSPALAVYKKVLTGDFIVETKMTVSPSRETNDRRWDGIMLTIPTAEDGSGNVTDLTLSDDTRYFTAGVARDGANQMVTRARINPLADGFPSNYITSPWPGNTWLIRIVKRGAYFTSYLRRSESEPWVLHNYVKHAPLAEAPSLVVSFVGISWGGNGGTALQYQDDDFEYLKAWRIGGLSGSYSNVFDAQTPVNWQTVNLGNSSKQTFKYQLRAGNTLANGTLTDAGEFVGPTGPGSFYTENIAQVVPSPEGKRYLEYKLFFDGTNVPAGDVYGPENLPNILRIITANYQPVNIKSKILSDAAEFGADAGGIQVQPGNGDLSLARTQIFMDEFNSTTLDPGWTFDPGQNILDPMVVGDYSLTERPGYLRMMVGWPQDFFVGTLELGGVKLYRNLPANVDPNNFEVETEINWQSQQSRQFGIILWQDKDNFAGIGMGRRFETWYETGVVSNTVMNDGDPGISVSDFSSNRLQLRVAKQGTYITLFMRDPNSNTPNWRMLARGNTANAATGGVDFAPTMVMIYGKSYGAFADPNTVNGDFNYVKVSNLAATGQKDFAMAIPAGAQPDAVITFSNSLNTTNTKFQVKNTSGTFVGPDGTSGSYFSNTEPKIPASLTGITDTAIRMFMSGQGGTPNLSAFGMQYATEGKVQRDSNRADFLLGTGQNVNLDTTPGIVANAGGLSFGTPALENFSSEPAGWHFSYQPVGTSSYSFTENPGYLRINAMAISDTWGPGANQDKPRISYYNTTPISGDLEVEAHITFPAGRQDFRHSAISIFQVRADGTTPDSNLDLENFVAFGPYRTAEMRILRADNNGYGDQGPAGAPDMSYYIRLRKVGRVFTGSYSSDGVNWTEATSYTMSHDFGPMYVGTMAKSWFLADGMEPHDFDYIKVTPISGNGVFESRVLDLGATGLSPIMESLGGNSATARIQLRAADSEAALASLPYVGPDGTAATSYAANYTGPITGVTGRYFQYRVTLPTGTVLNDVAIIGVTSTAPVLTRDDALNALRIAGGLQAATAADVTKLDLVKGASAGIVDLLDAAAILRKVNGL